MCSTPATHLLGVREIFKVRPSRTEIIPRGQVGKGVPSPPVPLKLTPRGQRDEGGRDDYLLRTGPMQFCEICSLRVLLKIEPKETKLKIHSAPLSPAPLPLEAGSPFSLYILLRSGSPRPQAWP